MQQSLQEDCALPNPALHHVNLISIHGLLAFYDIIYCYFLLLLLYYCGIIMCNIFKIIFMCNHQPTVVCTVCACMHAILYHCHHYYNSYLVLVSTLCTVLAAAITKQLLCFSFKNSQALFKRFFLLLAKRYFKLP